MIDPIPWPARYFIELALRCEFDFTFGLCAQYAGRAIFNRLGLTSAQVIHGDHHGQ